MNENEFPAERFEEYRPRLRAVALRLLGSPAEADDAVQETWLRVSRSAPGEVRSMEGWLITIVGRVALNMLRSRRTRRERPMDEARAELSEGFGSGGETSDPELQAVLSDSVGLALLVVLDALSPAERLAFVLHDVFAVPFEEIAPIVGRSTVATRKLASRARRRIHGAGLPDADPCRHRPIVGAFLAAARNGDFDELLRLLDPDVVLRADPAAVRTGAARELRGASAVAETFSGRARVACEALVDGAPGAVWATGGRPRVVFEFTVTDGRITAIDLIADPDRLASLNLEILDT
ncbi:sigma-70 family RNA polymerase sigma factor [Streptomyces sp. NPDC055078]